MLIEKLNNEKKELEKQLYIAEKSLKNCPEGRLRIAKNGKTLQYYHVRTNGDINGEYLKGDVTALIHSLAMKGYYEKFLKAGKKQLNSINKFLENYDPNALKNLAKNLNDYRKGWIQPLVLSDEEYITKWYATPYAGRSFDEDAPVYYTRKEERVRSKSEILIANTLNDLGIPYKYECPVNINKYGYVYVDFTILKIKTRDEIYLEHFGMLGKEGYRDDFFKKQSSFINNGLIQGKNFFMTFEDESHPLNTKDLTLFLKEIIKD